MLIGGKRLDAASAKTFETMDPATGRVLARVAEADAADVERAVAAARQALSGPWSRLSPAERERLLHRLADLVEREAESLAQLECLDCGKTIREAKNGDLPLAAALLRYFAGWPTKIHGETIPVSVPYYPGASFLHYTTREPVGVIGAIIPWNFPLLMAVERLAPALACGNALVLKPAEQTPLSALRLGELCLEAGLPEGVVNVVPGFGPTAGAALAGHPDVDKLTFTGSTEVGREIVKASAGNLKRLSLELGGKAPNIVFADADVEAAAKGLFMGAFYNQGQCCSAGSRVLVERPLFESLTAALVERAKTVRQGPGLNPKTQMGPLVSRQQKERVLGYIEGGVKEGARLLAGGEALAGEGYFVKPTVFSEAKDSMRICREEIFGPVVVVMPFDSQEEAVSRANATDYGLVAGVWTGDVKRAHRMARALKAGTVWVNCYHFVDAAAPWGGFKRSGYGREKSQYAIDLYTQLKSVWVDLN
ncbi:MAG: aldehyde dehydrogenase family protein [Elusimicrobia bacterium]|nr:aldehyde dehydrogenase family protein [Elusimicrobiota bacterium]MDE2426445.1 aldehyde dehydrogenase family protein [Elusimicrobiota bacterium]